MVEEKSKELEAEEEKSVTPDKIGKDDAGPARGKGKGAGKASATAAADAGKRERKTSADRKSRQARRNSMLVTPPPGAATPVSDGDNQR